MKRNLVQAKSLMEMLDTSIKRYHNKSITSLEMLNELLDTAHYIVDLDKESEKLGLTDYEYAFYTAVASNKSARELMKHEQLRELAVVLTGKLKQNVSIDWAIKENVRAKLRAIVKRTLNLYGYPPDMQLLTTETILKQAELIIKDCVG